MDFCSIVHVHLICGMPPNYPTEVPLLVDIVPKKGLGPDQVQELMVIAERTAAENLGMPSAYSIAMAVQEWLTENNLPGNDGSMYAGECSVSIYGDDRSLTLLFSRNAPSRAEEGR